MGSENNMVAVPVECTDEIAEAIALEANVCGGRASDIWHAAVTAARLASPQPDAQQGEGVAADTMRHASELLLTLARVTKHRTIDPTVPLAKDMLATAEKLANLAATPSSPALDAATIGRCIEAAQEERVEAEETKHPEDRAYNLAIEHVIAAIRALPNAEKRHG